MRYNDFKETNFGEWFENNIIPLPVIKVALFSQNPRLSGRLYHSQTNYNNTLKQLSVFSGILYSLQSFQTNYFFYPCVCFFLVVLFIDFVPCERGHTR